MEASSCDVPAHQQATSQLDDATTQNFVLSFFLPFHFFSYCYTSFFFFFRSLHKRFFLLPISRPTPFRCLALSHD